MSYKVTRNKREKYSKIVITWWEPFDSGVLGSRVPWWLDEVITFKVGDDPVKIPFGGVDNDDTTYTYFTGIERLDTLIIHDPSQDNKLRFPKNGDYDTARSRTSVMWIWGEDDNISISRNEFLNAGGGLQLDWDNETYETSILLQPPIQSIGVNNSFSITLEGSIPGLLIRENGIKFIKRSDVFYTEFYGKVDNTLEVDLRYITNRDQMYMAAQRLLEKYSYGNTTFSVDYFQEDIPIIDNKQLIPQTVTIDSAGKRSTNDAFIYNSLESIPEKPLSELGSSEHTLDDVQFYPLAFLS